MYNKIRKLGPPIDIYYLRIENTYVLCCILKYVLLQGYYCFLKSNCDINNYFFILSQITQVVQTKVTKTRTTNPGNLTTSVGTASTGR
jgi:hypothetical protein